MKTVMPRQTTISEQRSPATVRKYLEEAKTGDSVLKALAWAEAQGNPKWLTGIPTTAELAAWLTDCPVAARAEADRRLAATRPKITSPAWREHEGRLLVMCPVRARRGGLELDPDPPAEPLAWTFPGGRILDLAYVHAAWLALDDIDKPKHPAAPLVKAWTQRAKPPDKSLVRVAGGLARRVEIVSTILRTSWDDDGGVSAIKVDGQSLVARTPDFAGVFKPAKPKLRKFKPGEIPPLFPSVSAIPLDLRMTALSEVPDSPPALRGDVLNLLSLVHALRNPLKLTEQQGAGLLARGRNGDFRQPVASDVQRFLRACHALSCLRIWDPKDGLRWALLATVDPDPATGIVTIGPPAWLRRTRAEGNQRYTLTAEGGAVAKERARLGTDGGMADRIITGIEYRLMAYFPGGDGGPGPHVRPATGKTGPGPVVALDWREIMALAGDSWNPSDKAADAAAYMRFHRSMEVSGKYMLETKNEAEAGDTVEIVKRIRGGRGRQAGLKVRASARAVEAVRLANERQFQSVALTDWTGKPWPWL